MAFDIDLKNWTPKYLLEVSAKADGEAVSGPEWNRVWNLLREQGDYNTQSISELLAELIDTAWHPTDGAASITTLQLASQTTGDPILNVGGQLDYLDDTIAALAGVVAEQATAIAAKPDTHAELTGLDAADSHPIAAITGLQTALDNIVAGELSAINHNLLPNRDADGAHPISAITGLSAKVTTYDGIAVRKHNDWPDRDAAGAHAASAVTYDASKTVAQKIDEMVAAIQAITGGISEISHSSLTNRDATGSHPIAAITGLQGALDAKLAVSSFNTAIAGYQTKVLSGTGVPAAGLGNNGDIYIRYA